MGLRHPVRLDSRWIGWEFASRDSQFDILVCMYSALQQCRVYCNTVTLWYMIRYINMCTCWHMHRDAYILICIHVYIGMYVNIYAYAICKYVYMYTYASWCIYINIHTCIHRHVCQYICICDTSICIHVCICIVMHIYQYIHMYTYACMSQYTHMRYINTYTCIRVCIAT